MNMNDVSDLRWGRFIDSPIVDKLVGDGRSIRVFNNPEP
jgi:hypothetical protein